MVEVTQIFLQCRRKKLKLTIVYKCLNGLMVMPPNIFFPVNHSSWNLRSHGSIFLYQPFSHTNSYLHSCVPSSVSLWNQLPENFHHCLSLSSFKCLIDNIENFIVIYIYIYIYIFFFFRVNFALAYAICSSCGYISNSYKKSCSSKKGGLLLVFT